MIYQASKLDSLTGNGSITGLLVFLKSDISAPNPLVIPDFDCPESEL
jgi:hypothetical protein